MQPKLAAFSDKIYQNAPLFARIATVYGSMQNLTPVQQRLCWLYYTNFVRAGAKLDAGAKKRVAAINERLATLFANFSQNLLADEADYALYLKDEKDLAGLPAPLRAAAHSAAAARGHASEWAILNTRSSDGSVPDLFGSAGFAREGLANLLQPRRQWRRRLQQENHHGEILSLRCRARKAAGLPDACALAGGRQHGEDAGERHEPDDAGLARGGCARA